MMYGYNGYGIWKGTKNIPQINRKMVLDDDDINEDNE